MRSVCSDPSCAVVVAGFAIHVVGMLGNVVAHLLRAVFHHDGGAGDTEIGGAERFSGPPPGKSGIAQRLTYLGHLRGGIARVELTDPGFEWRE